MRIYENKTKVLGFYDSLSCLEGEFKVGLSVLRLEGREVKCIWIEVVNEGAEGHAIRPAAAKVLNFDVLKVREKVNYGMSFLQVLDSLFYITRHRWHSSIVFAHFQ